MAEYYRKYKVNKDRLENKCERWRGRWSKNYGIVMGQFEFESIGLYDEWMERLFEDINKFNFWRNLLRVL